MNWFKSWLTWVQCNNCDKIIWIKFAWKIKYKVADQKDYCDFDLCKECAKTWEQMTRDITRAQVYKQNQLLEEARQNARTARAERQRSLEVYQRNQSIDASSSSGANN